MFGLSSFLVRMIFCFFIVFTTYNPYGFSVFDYVFLGNNKIFVKLFLVLLYLWAYYILITATLSALGLTGSIFLAITSVILYLFINELGLFPSGTNSTSIALLFILSIFFGSGVSLTGIRNRFSKQVEARN